jgi:hypothetical protein
MTYRIINLSIKCSQFLSVTHSESITGFLLQYNSNIYLLSVHHHLPINEVYEKQTESPCNILVNSSWSEALIMDSHNIDTSQFLTFKKIQNSVKSLSEAFVIINGERNSGTNFLTNVLKQNKFPTYVGIIKQNIFYHWKHGIPREDVKLLNDEVIDIFIFRTLEEWLISMYHNVYHLKRMKNFHDFLLIIALIIFMIYLIINFKFL